MLIFVEAQMFMRQEIKSYGIIMEICPNGRDGNLQMHWNLARKLKIGMIDNISMSPLCFCAITACPERKLPLGTCCISTDHTACASFLRRFSISARSRLLRAELRHQSVHLRFAGLVQRAAQRHLRFTQSEFLQLFPPAATARGAAHEPFSMRPIRRFRNPFVCKCSKNSFMGGNSPPS